VVLALCDQDEWERAQSVAEPFERLVAPDHDPALWSHVWSLAMVLPALATLAPESPLLAELVAALEQAAIRDREGRILGWAPRTAEADPARVLSPVHTARVLLAIQHCRQATDRRLGLPEEELGVAVRRLLEHPHWDNCYEEIRRPIGVDRFEVLAIRHFTRAWVVRALLEFGVDPLNPRVRSTVAELYRGHDRGLWDWAPPGAPSIRRPAWATLDALRALEAYALRASQL
jgi:hypothetical protein